MRASLQTRIVSPADRRHPRGDRREARYRHDAQIERIGEPLYHPGRDPKPCERTRAAAEGEAVEIAGGQPGSVQQFVDEG